MPGAPAFTLASIPSLVVQALDQAQRSASTHRKNGAILYKLLLASSAVSERLPNGKGARLVGEKAFVDALKDAVNRVLAVKKGVVQADRCVRFLCAFVAYAVEQGARPFFPCLHASAGSAG